MLGGIIHGFRIPVSGLIVGSCAVICISLIAYYFPAKGAILKATIIVAIFKMILSPQAPLPAYFAVFFQGLIGELLFWHRRLYPVTCVLFSIIALLESGLQRIAVLTLVYGNDLWSAINDFLNRLTGQKSPANYSLIIGAAYVFLHILVGVFVGIWAGTLPGRIVFWKNNYPLHVQEDGQDELQNKKRKRSRKWLFATWIFLLLLYLQAELGIGDPLLPQHISIRILIRSVIIILSWYFLVAPVLKQVLNSWLTKKQLKLKDELKLISELLPVTRNLAQASWVFSRQRKGLPRLILFGKTLLGNAISESKRVYILTGKIGEGKTSSLLKWTKNRNDVYGILTPVINGKRYFHNASSGEEWPMEAGIDEIDALHVGKYHFSKRSFEKAIDVIRSAINRPGWLIIDELGPLELNEKGFFEITNEILDRRRQETVIVIRESLLINVIQKLKLDSPIIIRDVSQLITNDFTLTTSD